MIGMVLIAFFLAIFLLLLIVPEVRTLRASQRLREKNREIRKQEEAEEAHLRRIERLALIESWNHSTIE
jgi:hypothetical protein